MNKTILLAEDDPDDQLFFTAALEEVSAQAQLTIVSNGEAAFDFLAKSSVLPDICIFDINMPGVNGIDLLRKVRSDGRFKQLYIVMLTTSTDTPTADMCFDLGADAFYSKPGTHILLRETIRTILAGKRRL